MEKIKKATIDLLLNFWLVPFVGIIILVSKIASL